MRAAKKLAARRALELRRVTVIAPAAFTRRFSSLKDAVQSHYSCAVPFVKAIRGEAASLVSLRNVFAPNLADSHRMSRTQRRRAWHLQDAFCDISSASATWHVSRLRLGREEREKCILSVNSTGCLLVRRGERQHEDTSRPIHHDGLREQTD